jgi:phosphopantothenoylcysteine decarboxylase/phosphopantothenate--cysteine ligase
MKVLDGKRIVLGISGSIAAYKAVELASRLTKSGALVDAVLTDAARKLISPVSFSSVTGRRAYIDEDLWRVSDHVLHIDLGEHNQAFLIAPATANTIAKMAHGIADNLLTLASLASRTVPIIAPAMDGGMYTSPATQENLEILKNRGVEIWGPAAGHLASGLSGKGRMLEPWQLEGLLRQKLGKEGALRDRKVLVTAGGTQEPIDPVRVISNRSSGKQGYAIAQAAIDQGAEVILISGPTCLQPPIGVELISVNTAEEMADSVILESSKADVLIMAAAVADYRPLQVSANKIKKGGEKTLTIELTQTRDILRSIAESKAKEKTGPILTIGFAAETKELLENARKKLDEKELDMIVANDVSQEESGFGSEDNQVIFIWKDGKTEEFPLLSKMEVAENLIDEVVILLERSSKQ